MNELILILSLLAEFGLILLAYRLFGRSGLYVMTAVYTLLANIEVAMLVDAFGIEQTLGNILFAGTFLITDILSELEGKRAAQKAVHIGVFTSFVFILITQSWMLYTPAWESLPLADGIRTVFSATPRIAAASLAVYALTQRFDVWLYHKWWAFTEKRFGKERFLWLRNNGSTLVSQLLNTVLFNVGAFFGVYDGVTLVKICAAGYVIYVVTSLLDTPFIYAARAMKRKGLIPAAAE